MGAEWIIALSAVVGAIGGALGAWISVRVTVAITDQRVITIAEEVKSLRKSVHDLRDTLPITIVQWSKVARGEK